MQNPKIKKIVNETCFEISKQIMFIIKILNSCRHHEDGYMVGDTCLKQRTMSNNII
jgi:hypothetical protein